MAYVAITNGEIDTDSPLTTGLMTKFRDNPEAIAEGLSGATRIVRGAISPGVGHRWFFDYGDESDGAITHSASASIAPGLYQCTTFQIDATFTVDLSAMGPLIICATTSITINGTLDVDGMGARGGDEISGQEDGQPGMFGGSGGGASSTGGDTYLTAGGAALTAGSAQSARTKATLLSLMPIFNVRASFDASQNGYQSYSLGDAAVGGGGGSGRQISADYGGAGGGLVVLCAPLITVGATGVITADGLTGEATFGGGGGGGAIILATPSGGLTETGGSSVAAAGGPATTSGGAGGAGWVERITLT